MSATVEDAYTVEKFEDLLAAAEKNASTPWETECTTDMRVRFNSYKGKMYISDGEIEKLEKIAST